MSDELNQLKATADSLSIEYPHNIGVEKLKERINEAMTAQGLETPTEPTAEEIEAMAKEQENADNVLNNPENLNFQNAAPTSQKTRAQGRISKAMKLAVKKKEPRKSRRVKQVEVWITTPFQLPLTDPDTGRALLDNDGDPLAINKLTCCPNAIEAKRLIKKYQAQIDIDVESGEIVSETSYGLASKEELEAYQEEMATRRKFRAITIKQRRLKNAKTIVNVTEQEVQESA